MFNTTSSDLQDVFAQTFLPTPSTFLDIGCGHGRHGSNSFILEQLGWTGILVDHDRDLIELNKTFRRQPCIRADVTTCDWKTILDKDVYDYISFDVDGATIDAVKNFPWESVRFKIMTIEHDLYARGPEARSLIRQTMNENGYTMIAHDVCTNCTGEPFEDWFVDPNHFSPDMIAKYFSMGKRAIDVLYNPK